MGKVTLRVEDVHFKHKKQGAEVLKGISFEAERGTVTAILGPNGSGKTTLLKCICGLWKCQKGSITFEGKNVDKLTVKERAKLFSFVFQDHYPTFPYSVLDVVLLGRTSYVGLFSVPKHKDFEIALQAIKMVGIEYLKDVPYTQISGGERQLSLVARALAQDAPCMLLDEPTSHLDFKNQIEILKRVRELALRQSLTVIMTLHDPNLALLLTDKTIVINSGVKIAEGPSKDVITPDVIRAVYGIEAKVVSVGEQRLVYPSI
ncbi:MAG: ABC transporter ATP-binding protein [Desulfobacterota bacterium]|nr:ABC transporter ATP-binding protein [Thermodesulfobacteriota bacterium]MDW8002670.1 ABC transporter ATP-binding protein [Deltaproteobacteria bacterium]